MSTAGGFGSGQSPPGRSRSHRFLIWALLAMALVTVGSVVVAVVAVRSRSDGAVAGGPSPSPTGVTAAPASPTDLDGPTVTTAPATTGAPTITDDPTSSDTSTVEPGRDYVLAYERKRLSLPCQAGADLDEPRVNVQDSRDLTYCNSTRNGIPVISFPGDHAIVRSAAATPEDCEQAIQLSPSTDALVTKAGLVFCLVTDGVTTVPGGGASPKTCIVTVNSVDVDNRLAITVTAYTNPT
jgi:hypothetical protein